MKQGYSRPISATHGTQARGQLRLVHAAPISGEELLCQAAGVTRDYLHAHLTRVPADDPLRPEIEAYVFQRAALAGPGPLG